MQRREFITLLGGAAAAWPLSAQAQSQLPRRIGFLTYEQGPTRNVEAFQNALRALGHIEGQTILIDYRFGAGDTERLRVLAAKLIASRVELIVAPETASAVVASRATTVIPIVFAVTADPLGTGLVSNLARPAGNVTGLTTGNSETAGKRLALLKEAFPNIVRVVAIYNAEDPSNIAVLPVIQAASPRLGLRLEAFAIRTADDIGRVFSSISPANADALVVLSGVVTVANLGTVVQHANATGLPAVYSQTLFVQGGGLMAYSADTVDLYRRAAGYVDKILKGAKPGDLPVEFPTKFELLINLKTAKALGLTVPPALLARADEVIE